MKRVTLVHVDWKTNISIFLVVNYSNYAEPLVSEYVIAGYPGTLGASKHVESLGSSVIDYVLVGNAIESVNVKDFNNWSDHAQVELCIHNVKSYQRN